MLLQKLFSQQQQQINKGIRNSEFFPCQNDRLFVECLKIAIAVNATFLHTALILVCKGKICRNLPLFKQYVVNLIGPSYA